jgi:hypothetical protein
MTNPDHHLVFAVTISGSIGWIDENVVASSLIQVSSQTELKWTKVYKDLPSIVSFAFRRLSSLTEPGCMPRVKILDLLR